MEEEILPQSSVWDSSVPEDFEIDQETLERMQMKYQKCKASFIKMKGRPLSDPNEFNRYMKSYIVKNYDKLLNEVEEELAGAPRSFMPEYALDESTGTLDIVGVRLAKDENEVFELPSVKPDGADMQPQTSAKYHRADMQPQSSRAFRMANMQPQTSQGFYVQPQTSQAFYVQPQISQGFLVQPQISQGFLVQPQTIQGFQMAAMQPQTSHAFQMAAMQPQTSQGSQMANMATHEVTFEEIDEQPQCGTIQFIDENGETRVLQYIGDAATQSFQYDGGQLAPGDIIQLVDGPPPNGVCEIVGDDLQVGAYEIVGDQEGQAVFELVGEPAQPAAAVHTVVGEQQPQAEKFNYVRLPPSGQLEVIGLNSQAKHTLEVTDAAGKTITYIDLPLLNAVEPGTGYENVNIDPATMQSENLLIQNVEVLPGPSTYLITYKRAPEAEAKVDNTMPPPKMWRRK